MNLRKELFFTLSYLVGSNVEKYYKEFLEIESWDENKLKKYSQNKLNFILNHAVRNVNFYKNQLGNSKISLEKFPIVTKETLKEYYFDFMTERLKREYFNKKKFKRYSWIEMKTGGSTGEPTKVIHDLTFREYGRAGRLYCNYLCGFPIGTPYFQLWGSMNDINRMKNNFNLRVMSLILGVKLLNAFRMTEERMKEYVKIINNSSIKNMMAYVDSAYYLSKYIEDNQLNFKKLKSVMGCAGTVTDDFRNKIELILAEKLHNKYGSRECNDISCECSEGGMHIFTNQVIIEIVDDNGQVLDYGKEGNILVTLLNNLDFPLIRYKIGDIGILSDEKCICGRPFPLFKTISGRSYEIIKDTKGNYISPVYFRHLIGVVHASDYIKRFQLIQEQPTKYKLLLEVPYSYSYKISHKLIENIKRDLITVLGKDSILEIIIVDRINETESGKFLYTKNLMLKK